MRGELARLSLCRNARGCAGDGAPADRSGIGKEDRVALIAETGADFAALFCACVYVGAWPVPLPLPTSFGGKESFIDQLAVQLMSSDPKILLYPAEIAEMAAAAAARQGCAAESWAGFRNPPRCPIANCRRPAPTISATCNIPAARPVSPPASRSRTKALLHNLYGHSTTMNLGENDRCVSWLPWYHDMGLVGCLLSLIANQVSGDYLKPDAFARRPLAWLDMISRNKGNTLSYSPTFGYDICARRISSQSNVAERFDLSRWRIAGNGADMIRPDVMQNFVNAFRRSRVQGSKLHPVLWPCRSGAGGDGDAAGRRASGSNWSRKSACRARRAICRARPAIARSSTAASRCPTWMSRSGRGRAKSAAITRSARSGAAAPA
jgi:fatty-acyl-CoA synthase